MKRTLLAVALLLTMPLLVFGQATGDATKEEFSKLEKDFAHAIVKNDADAIGRFLADDWIIIEPDGGIIDKTSFLGVIKSGTLTHESMESEDHRVRLYGDTAVVTGVTRSRGKYAGQEFTTQERATDVFVKQNQLWRCVFSQLTRLPKK